MIKEMLNLRKQIKREKPLIHSITNPISIHDCANVILAAGGRPIMAEHPKEAAQITGTAKALMLNLGNITDVRMESMEISRCAAKEKGIPVVLDLVGVSCSDLRYEYAKTLLSKGGITILKGNISELLAIAGQPSHSIGIDAGREDALSGENLSECRSIFEKLSGKTGALVLASGENDLIIGPDGAYLASNGVEMLSGITGTGCMLGALCAAYLSAGSPLSAALLSVSMMGIAGELAAEKSRYPGTFQIELLNQLYGMEDRELKDRIKISRLV